MAAFRQEKKKKNNRSERMKLINDRCCEEVHDSEYKLRQQFLGEFRM